MIDTAMPDFSLINLLKGSGMAVGMISLALLCFYCHRKESKFSKIAELAIIAAVCLFIYAVRSELCRNFILNVDEADWATTANTLLVDPRYMVSTIFPPLLTYPLLLIKLFNSDIDFYSVKVFGVINWIACFILLYYALRNIFKTGFELLSLLPYVTFVALLSYFDFVAYNSEHNPNLMLALSFYAYSLRYCEKNARFAYPLLGFVIGCFIYTKIQLAPVGLILVLFVGTTLILRKQWRYLMQFCIALALPVMVVLGIVWYNGALDTYLATFSVSKGYAASGLGNEVTLTWFEKIAVVNGQVNKIIELKLFILGTTLLIALAAVIFIYAKKQVSLGQKSVFIASVLLSLGLLYRYPVHSTLLVSVCTVAGLIHFDAHVKNKYAELLLFTLSCAFASLYIILLPPTQFTHYLILFITPYCILFTSIILTVISLSKEFDNGLSAALSKAFICVMALVLLVQITCTYLARNINYTYANIATLNYTVDWIIAENVRKYARKYERVAVWGWASKFQVMTQTTSPTRIFVPFLLISSFSPNDRWLNLYYSDLVQNKPVVIIDAVAPAQFKYDQLHEFPHEAIPAIRHFVSAGYTHVATVDGVRIFASNKRLQELRVTGNLLK